MIVIRNGGLRRGPPKAGKGISSSSHCPAEGWMAVIDLGAMNYQNVSKEDNGRKCISNTKRLSYSSNFFMRSYHMQDCFVRVKSVTLLQHPEKQYKLAERESELECIF